MDFLQPPQQVSEVLAIAQIKAKLSTKALILRGMLAGMALGFAILFAWACAGESASPAVAALVFPSGFAVITLLALELVTGNFAIVLFGFRAGSVTRQELLRNWSWSMVGNALGSVLMVGLVGFVFSQQTDASYSLLANKLLTSAEMKTVAFASMGPAGWLLVLVKAILCGILVGLASFLGLSSMSSFGRLVSVWFPIAMFFALGFEHLVVNMFVIPAGMLLGAHVSIGTMLIWNLMPVLLGNLVGAAGVALALKPPQ
ncbi:MAG TPA: formate/nitrite transporter family protein [Fimbriimonas sp.]|nr:formate/nitrite transporter family protein [Fimbriimonas sp.]